MWKPKIHYNRILLINFTVFAVTSMLCVVIAEIALRLYGIVPSADRMYAYEFDDILGWTTKQSFKYFRSTPYYSHFNYYNPEGFPTTKEDWSQKTDHQKPSIVFIGDSFTEGYYLPYEFTFTYLLGKKLDHQSINLGVSGYAPDQYLLTARKHLQQYNVSKIIVMFFPYNDLPDIFNDTYQGYAKPMFGDNVATPINLPLRKLKGKPKDENWLQVIAHSSAIYAVIRSSVRKYFELPTSGSNRPILYEKEHVRKALSLVKQIQIEFPVQRFIVYYIPVYEEISQHILKANVRTYQEICTEFTLECFSLGHILRDGGNPQNYYGEDGHFSRKGTYAVANHLYTILSEK